MKEDGYIHEFGCSPNVRFPELGSVHMYDSEGKIVLCKCGKEATDSVIGKSAFLALCHECCEKYS